MNIHALLSPDDSEAARPDHPPSGALQARQVPSALSARYQQPAPQYSPAPLPPQRHQQYQPSPPAQYANPGYQPPVHQQTAGYHVPPPYHQQQHYQTLPIQQQQPPAPAPLHIQSPPSSNRLRPTPPGSRHSTSSLSHELARSPDLANASPPTRHVPSPQYGSSTPPRGARRQLYDNPVSAAPAANFRPHQQPPTSNPDPSARFHSGDAQSRPAVTHRPSSTPQVETASSEHSCIPVLRALPPQVKMKLTSSHEDLVSPIDRTKAVRAYSANSVKKSERAEKRASPLHSPLSAVTPAITRTISRQSVADLTMADAPAPTPPPRNISSAALTDTDSRTVTELLGYLREHSYAYDQHVDLVNLLHKGFLAHTCAIEGSPAGNDPHTYSLLTEMRQARDALDSRFAVGEDLWQAWLSDEILIATTTEERMTVMELCQRAVQDEPMSVKLWLIFIDWFSASHAACFDLEGSNQTGWTRETKADCRELFTRDMLKSILEQAVSATRWRIDESYLVWARYIPLVLQEMPKSPSAADLGQLQELFLQRMQTPHAESHEIEQAFWSAISRVPHLDWEAIMAQAKQQAEPAQREMAARVDDEFALQRALHLDDPHAVKAAFNDFIHAEKFRKPRGPLYYDLRCAAYERALLRFPTATEWWLDYVDYAMIAPGSDKALLMPLIERATRHCPGSGDLWSRRILRADVERKSRDEVEAIKHKATNSGLLDLGGMEEMVKMLQQWCSYLRRHAFSRINEDARDTAEFGIMSALDDIYQAGKKVYGNDFPGDPLFRLEQVQIKFYTESRRVGDARNIYESLAKKALYARSYDFWNKYYNWELTQWGCELVLTEKHRVETSRNGPDRATKVVQKAIAQKNLDLPGSVLELYLYHFQQHESAHNLQAGLADARQFTLRLARQAEKAAREAAEQQQAQIAAAAAAATQAHTETATPDSSVPTGGEKRKRDEDLANGYDHKRPKTETSAQQVQENHSVRNRENNTVTIKNLAPDTNENDIRAFFSGFGAILSISILHADTEDSAAATVEFESQEDAKSSIIRSGKPCKGREVSIQSGGQNVLYVCNYPPDYDEATIRGLFKHYGEIVNVRFPSLNLNARRRFCYISFLTADMAKAAEEAMDGKKLDGLHTLTAKISDPEAKKHRSGPQEEGREIFVKNLDRNTPEDDIKAFFAQYGQVESFHLLRHVNKQLTGSGFFVYSTADEAKAAVDDANQKPFSDRILSVALSTPKGKAAPLDRMKKQDIIIKQPSATPEPHAAGNGEPGRARKGSDVSMASSAQPGDDSYKTVRERKIAIFDLPDTVNDARVRAAMEKFGSIVKIQMRREIQGAIIEFADVKVAFNVRQGVDVSTLGEGVTTGDVGDLLARKKNKKPSNGLMMMPSAVAHRPVGGKRGGLGVKRGGSHGTSGGHAASQVAAQEVRQDPASTGGEDGGAKSNADFRRMFAASSTQSENQS